MANDFGIMPELLLADEVYEVVGAAMEVYYQLGIGFLEAVYQEALEIELAQRHIPYESQKRLVMNYKGQQLQKNTLPIWFVTGKLLSR